MKNRDITKLLILFIAVFTCGKVMADVEAELPLRSEVQPAVSIEKTLESYENGTVNPQTGVHEGLRSVFTFETNGTDDDYDFVLTSSIATADSVVSAYTSGGTGILFAHTSIFPTMTDINSAKVGGDINKSVIAYPITVTATSPVVSSYSSGNAKYGDCYVITVNGAESGKLTQTVSGTPISGTYNIGQDPYGTYRAVVTFTAIGK